MVTTRTHEEIAEFVRARLIEAAETERRLPWTGIGPAGRSTVWPDMDPPSPAEVAAYGYTERERRMVQQDEADALAAKKSALPVEVSRMMETVEWVAAYVSSVDRRHAVLAWARSKAGGRSFRRWCREKGLHLNTARRRVDAAISDVAAQVGNKYNILSHRDAEAVCTLGPKLATEAGMMAEADAAPMPVRHGPWMAPDAKPVAHDETDPDSTAAAARGVEEARRRARALQERRRRAKLGAEDGERGQA